MFFKKKKKSASSIQPTGVSHTVVPAEYLKKNPAGNIFDKKTLIWGKKTIYV